MRKMGFMPKRDYRHPVSRDYQQISCGSTSCEWNMGKFCSVPSLFKIGENGKCEGYCVKKDIMKPLDGD